jgi:hypothetical protein
MDEHPLIVDNIAHAVLWADWLQATTHHRMRRAELLLPRCHFNHPRTSCIHGYCWRA